MGLRPISTRVGPSQRRAVQGDPNAFGAAQGAALSQVGAGVAQVGQGLQRMEAQAEQERREQEAAALRASRITAQSAHNDFRVRLSDAMYGEGGAYSENKGLAAFRNRDSVQETLSELIDRVAEDQQLDGDALDMFRQSAQADTVSALDGYNRFAMREQAVAEQETVAAAVELDINKGANAARAGVADITDVETYMHDGLARIRSFSVASGEDASTIRGRELEYKTRYAAAVVSAYLQSGEVGTAREYLSSWQGQNLGQDEMAAMDNAISRMEQGVAKAEIAQAQDARLASIQSTVQQIVTLNQPSGFNDIESSLNDAISQVREVYEGADEDEAITRVSQEFNRIRKEAGERRRAAFGETALAVRNAVTIGGAQNIIRDARQNGDLTGEDISKLSDVAEQSIGRRAPTVASPEGLTNLSDQERLRLKTTIRRYIDLAGDDANESVVIEMASGLKMSESKELLGYLRAGGAVGGLTEAKVRNAMQFVEGSDSEPDAEDVGLMFDYVASMAPAGRDLQPDDIRRLVGEGYRTGFQARLVDDGLQWVSWSGKAFRMSSQERADFVPELTQEVQEAARTRMLETAAHLRRLSSIAEDGGGASKQIVQTLVGAKWLEGVADVDLQDGVPVPANKLQQLAKALEDGTENNKDVEEYIFGREIMGFPELGVSAAAERAAQAAALREEVLGQQAARAGEVATEAIDRTKTAQTLVDALGSIEVQIGDYRLYDIDAADYMLSVSTTEPQWFLDALEAAGSLTEYRQSQPRVRNLLAADAEVIRYRKRWLKALMNYSGIEGD